uniref:Uncharacterized protein n=1 Tax=Rhizophora mucronata TaxID=61149 RepID=A0A2P2QWH8_RHIMU
MEQSFLRPHQSQLHFWHGRFTLFAIFLVEYEI